MKIDKSIFHRYIPRIADRYNSVGAFVLTVVGGILVIFAMGIYMMCYETQKEDIESVAQTIHYDGAYPEVHRAANLYDAGKYVNAIALADSLIQENDRADIPELHRRAAESRNADRDYELTWVKINSLVGMGHEQDARLLLDSYVNIKGKYRKEAKELLGKI